MKILWLKASDSISEVMRIPLLDTFDLNVITYLNMMSYVNYKNMEIEKMYKRKG